MISSINGYVCFSSCDEAKAKQGKDPQALPGATDEKAKSHQPAVIFDGALKGSEAPNGDGTVQKPLVNVLA
jgi:hypothetical protein